MGALSRTKGNRGERELATMLAELTGLTIKRRVRQHDGDSDLEGIPGWSVEVKRAATPKIAQWWAQTVAQAGKANQWPVLFYRLDGKKWRAVWPIHLLSEPAVPWQTWEKLEFTVESWLEGWAFIYRETLD